MINCREYSKQYLDIGIIVRAIGSWCNLDVEERAVEYELNVPIPLANVTRHSLVGDSLVFGITNERVTMRDFGVLCTRPSIGRETTDVLRYLTTARSQCVGNPSESIHQ